MFAFSGQIFNLLPDLIVLIINNYGFDFTLNLWKVQNDTLGSRAEVFWANVSVGPFLTARRRGSKKTFDGNFIVALWKILSKAF